MKKPKKPTIGEKIVFNRLKKTLPGFAESVNEFRSRGSLRHARDEAAAIDRALRRAFRDGVAAEQHDGIYSPKTDLGFRNRERLCGKYGVKP